MPSQVVINDLTEGHADPDVDPEQVVNALAYLRLTRNKQRASPMLLAPAGSPEIDDGAEKNKAVALQSQEPITMISSLVHGFCTANAPQDKVDSFLNSLPAAQLVHSTLVLCAIGSRLWSLAWDDMADKSDVATRMASPTIDEQAHLFRLRSIARKQVLHDLELVTQQSPEFGDAAARRLAAMSGFKEDKFVVGGWVHDGQRTVRFP
jgi:hypothetical protein